LSKKCIVQSKVLSLKKKIIVYSIAYPEFEEINNSIAYQKFEEIVNSIAY